MIKWFVLKHITWGTHTVWIEVLQTVAFTTVISSYKPRSISYLTFKLRVKFHVMKPTELYLICDKITHSKYMIKPLSLIVFSQLPYFVHEVRYCKLVPPVVHISECCPGSLRTSTNWKANLSLCCLIKVLFSISVRYKYSTLQLFDWVPFGNYKIHLVCYHTHIILE